MPEVSVAVELTVEVEPGMDPLVFERQVDAQGKQAARALYEKALEELGVSGNASGRGTFSG